MQRRSVLKAGVLGLSLWRPLRAAEPLRLATFADYIVPEALAEFSDRHGVGIETVVFDSNEELLAASVRGERFDLLTISHYMVPHFAALGLLQTVPAAAIDALQPEHWDSKLARYGRLDKRWIAVPKNSGTTGFIYRRSRLPAMTGWRAFWDAIPAAASKRCSVIDDVQSLLGAALRYHGDSMNSTRPQQLLRAEQLLQDRRPHIRALATEASEAITAGDWLTMAWSDGGYSLSAENADLIFVNPDDGGDIWCDFYAIGADSQQLASAVALLSWLLQPEQIAREVAALGVSPVDNRVLSLLPDAVRKNPIVFPSRPLLAAMESSSQEALREPLRGEIFARFAASFQ